MSRSYKHTPYYKCEKSCRVGKHIANIKVRRSKEEFKSGSMYKKLYDSWDICDYEHICFWKEYVNNPNNQLYIDDLEYSFYKHYIQK